MADDFIDIETTLRIPSNMIIFRNLETIELVCCQYAPINSGDEALLFRFSKSPTDRLFNAEIHWYKAEKEVYTEQNKQECIDVYNKYYPQSALIEIQKFRRKHNNQQAPDIAVEYKLKMLCSYIGLNISRACVIKQIVPVMHNLIKSYIKDFHEHEACILSGSDDIDLLDIQIQYMDLLDIASFKTKEAHETRENPKETMSVFLTCIDKVLQYVSNNATFNDKIPVVDNICSEFLSNEEVIHAVSELVCSNEDQNKYEKWIFEEGKYRIRRILGFIYRHIILESHSRIQLQSLMSFLDPVDNNRHLKLLCIESVLTRLVTSKQ